MKMSCSTSLTAIFLSLALAVPAFAASDGASSNAAGGGFSANPDGGGGGNGGGGHGSASRGGDPAPTPFFRIAKPRGGNPAADGYPTLGKAQDACGFGNVFVMYDINEDGTYSNHSFHCT